MGAKASTANSGHQSPRTRTFSTSSSTDVVSAGTAPGFNLLRALPGVHVQQNDRQRARSLSSVPDLQAANNNNNSHHHSHHGNHASEGIPVQQSSAAVAGQMYGEHSIMMGAEDGILAGDESSQAVGNAAAAAAAANAAAAAGALALGRVYTATSLPSHIWSLNGK